MKTKKALLIAALALLALVSVLFLLFHRRQEAEIAPAAEKGLVRVAVVSDIHYTGERDYVYTGSFAAANDASGTGKQVELLPSLLDAFVDEMLALKPDVLLITGDNAFNGATVSHEALIKKLLPLRESGICVLTLPGNHDVNTAALRFPAGEAESAASPTPGEFAALYADFGYDAALSRDEASLSYVYDSGRGARFFMLDTNFRYGAVYGRVSDDTLRWLDQQLKACRDAGDRAVVAGHHNLLAHNPLFTFTHTVDNSDALCAVLSEYGVNFFLSGHLHPQSIAARDGLYDIATESFAVYPHRYGLLELDDEVWRYQACQTDVASWAAKKGVSDERLLQYEDYGEQFLYNATASQLAEQLAEIEDVKLRDEIVDRLSRTNVGYFIGEPLPAPDASLTGILNEAELGFWAGYLSTVTDLPSSLYAEGSFPENP